NKTDSLDARQPRRGGPRLRLAAVRLLLLHGVAGDLLPLERGAGVPCLALGGEAAVTRADIERAALPEGLGERLGAGKHRPRLAAHAGEQRLRLGLAAD